MQYYSFVRKLHLNLWIENIAADPKLFNGGVSDEKKQKTKTKGFMCGCVCYEKL